ncbi:MAG: Ig-like domain-containing protein [Burkholderia sp.]
MAAAKVTRPGRPTIDSVTTNTPPHQGVVPQGGLTNDPRPTLSGHGEKGATIHILVDGREVGTVKVGSTGTWTFPIPTLPTDNVYRFTARASNDGRLGMPSQPYGIALDTTPPPKPIIKAVSDGPGQALSGDCEPYAMVAIYDGARKLGTVQASPTGQWVYPLPAGLGSGTELTVTAQDAAGNVSVKSNPFSIAVEPVAPPEPTVKATLVDLGRDSGLFDFDRVTNDGSAGRFMSGKVTGKLTTGEKVQVSTDGGITWIDAIVKSDGTWVAIDPSVHNGNWTVSTRVINSAGKTGAQSEYDVTLDTAAPDAPQSVSRAGDTISVTFAAAKLEAGSVINVQIGDYRIEYQLTTADIASGRASVKIPADILSKMDEHSSYGVAIVDVSGNLSYYLTTHFDYGASKGESPLHIDYQPNDFSRLPVGTLPSVPTFDFGLVTIANPANASIQVAGTAGFAAENAQTIIRPPAGQVGLLYNFDKSGLFTLDVNATAHALSLDMGISSQQLAAQFDVKFYNASGREIYSFHLPLNASQFGSEIQHLEIVLPGAMMFSSFKIVHSGNTTVTNDLAWLSNIGFAGGEFSTIHDPIHESFKGEENQVLKDDIPKTFGEVTIVGSRMSVYSEALLVNRSGHAKIYINHEKTSQSLSIDVTRSNVTEFKIVFFDKNGNELYQYIGVPDLRGTTAHYDVILPAGMNFTSFDISVTKFQDVQGHGTYITLDNIGFGGSSYGDQTWHESSSLIPPADVQQVVSTDNAAYFGSAQGTDFHLDNVAYFDGNHAALHGGAGIDKLVLTGANQVLNVSSLLHVGDTDKLSSIEVIDITGSGNNTLKLSMSDVLELGHESLFRNDGHTQMMVNGNAGDRVVLSGMAGIDQGKWEQAGATTYEGRAYTVYENTALNVEVLIQNGVSTQVV